METPDGKEPTNTNRSDKKSRWMNDDRVKLIKLRFQGLTVEEIGRRIGRSKHAARSEYGRIRRGETNVVVSLGEMPELREVLPLRRAPRSDPDSRENMT